MCSLICSLRSPPRSWSGASLSQGAAGYVSDALMTGVQFAAGWEEHFFVQRETFRLLAAQSPALFELMPAPSARAARRCQECRARGCTGACVTGEHEEQVRRVGEHVVRAEGTRKTRGGRIDGHYPMEGGTAGGLCSALRVAFVLHCG